MSEPHRLSAISVQNCCLLREPLGGLYELLEGLSNATRLDLLIPEEILQRVVLVCDRSGYRGEGMFKVIDENRNMHESLSRYPEIAGEHPWFIGCVEEHDLFFQNLLSALRPTFPNIGSPDGWAGPNDNYPQPWRGHDYSQQLKVFEVVNTRCRFECFKRLMSVCCAPCGLLYQQKQNRLARKRFLEAQLLIEKIQWVQIWIDVKELFFEDLRRALRFSSEGLPAWAGGSLNTVLLSFDSGQPD